MCTVSGAYPLCLPFYTVVMLDVQQHHRLSLRTDGQT